MLARIMCTVHDHYHTGGCTSEVMVTVNANGSFSLLYGQARAYETFGAVAGDRKMGVNYTDHAHKAPGA